MTEEFKCPRLPTARLNGEEEFKYLGITERFSVKDYWAWAHSDLVVNVERGALAEYLVASALRLSGGKAWRDLWADSDLVDGTNLIEVKSASYIQAWSRQDFSKVVFTGLRGRSVFDLENKGHKEYKSDVYVLSLQSHKDHKTFDVFDLDQWKFWVFSRKELTHLSKDASSVSLKRIEEHGHTPVVFVGSASAIRSNS